MAPLRAKGRAKMECSHLIISRVTRRLWRTGTGLGYQFSVLSSRFSVLSSQFSVLGSQFSVLSSQFSVLSSQFSVLSSQFSVLRNALFAGSCLLPSFFHS